ncbi:hypothetical protein J8L98_09890 [Pseudoalteromonas sp. MMG013]|uniref:formyltransferase family protein n=1 Tax=Pseudoalteromonas sp. MMG013 TaxID=2822687 RepID=UPI001B380BFA|nr:formyltransferase family protein [Pseudoalteromonas sp. MMG013]MBQ4862000.1 hypothetical protein [Pseudoalteromonas sp. MMG013]
MKVAFIGCVETSHAAFTQLLSHHVEGEIELVALITKSQSVFNSDYASLVELAQEFGIETTFFVNDIDYDKALSNKHIDMLFCIGWSHIIPNRILHQVKKAAIGFHPAKLPSNRGRHPLIWALALGLSETASSFFLMEEKVDSGALVDQEIINISDTDYARDLYNKVLLTIPRQISKIVTGYCDNSIESQPQIAASSSYWRKRSAIDGAIDWRMQAKDIYNLIRALSSPYPGATFLKSGEIYTVTRATHHTEMVALNLEPGKILNTTRTQVHVKCSGTSSLWLENIDGSQFTVGEYL